MSKPVLLFLTAGLFIAADGCAHAADIAVQVAGRSPTQIRQDVLVAADKACDRAVAMNDVAPADEDQCVSDTVDSAMKQINAQTNDFHVAAADGAGKQ